MGKASKPPRPTKSKNHAISPQQSQLSQLSPPPSSNPTAGSNILVPKKAPRVKKISKKQLDLEKPLEEDIKIVQSAKAQDRHLPIPPQDESSIYFPWRVDNIRKMISRKYKYYI